MEGEDCCCSCHAPSGQFQSYGFDVFGKDLKLGLFCDSSFVYQACRYRFLNIYIVNATVKTNQTFETRSPIVMLLVGDHHMLAQKKSSTSVCKCKVLVGEG